MSGRAATNLERFVAAQAGVQALARAEIAAGHKVGHWMWFVFPQLRGLGRSAMAESYGIADLDEAAAYLAHPVLGARLAEMAGLILTHCGRLEADQILGPVDAMKLRSSMTLFAAVPGAPAVFDEVLAAFFQGAPCPLTTARLGL